MTEKPPFYITTPIYYVNGAPHVGSAYTTIACDAMARFKRLDGYDVRFLTGTDEHGQKVAQAAEKAGKSPQDFVNEVSGVFRDMCDTLDITNDYFIRTTDEDHKVGARKMWDEMLAKGDIYLDKYAGWYSVRDEAFYQESELETREDGSKFAPVSGADVEWVEEESYFFKLSAYQEKLLKFYEANPDFVQPKGRYNEVKRFVESGLRDLSISRATFNWGVPVPGDERHVMYVWVDALTNYITYLGYPDRDAEDFKKFWPADCHVVGKDILRFHAVYWPAFLMSADIECPKRIYAHGWWTVEGEKMSKSLGNVIAPADLVNDYGLDQSRYFLLREVPFGNDGDFSKSALIQRMNSDLANSFGNLVQRTLSMIFKNCDGQIPVPGDFTAEDNAMLDMAGTKMLKDTRVHMDNMAFNRALENIWRVIGEANAYVDTQAPWALKKTDFERMKTVLYVLAEVIRNLALITQPFVPEAAKRILDQLKIDKSQRSLDYMGAEHREMDGTPIDKPQGVFPRYVDEDAV